MHIQDLFIKYYDFRPFDNHKLINKIIGNSSKILGLVGNFVLPIWFKCFPLNFKKEKAVPVSVCLTSFPLRIHKVWLVIECLLRQSMQPKEVRLYLSKEQFNTMEMIPSNLNKYIYQEFLKIHLVDDDIKSHKKYWYATDDNKYTPLIIIDDDIIYSSNTIESLWLKSQNNPKCVIASYCKKITWDKNSKKILPYSQWKGKIKKGEKGNHIFFGSGGGTYFPCNSIVDANESINTIKEICPLADDIWLNAIVRKNGFNIVCVKKTSAVPEWKRWNNLKLSTINNGEKFNDVQLEQVITFFESKYNINPYKF